ncbi:hypothetical protein Tco_1195306 [Tanacetum coccineum]
MRAFWSLNKDILKITILKTNTSYPSMKIRRIRACTHQRPQKNKTQYAVSRETQYAVFKIWNEYNILKDIKHGPYSKKSPIRRIQYLDMPTSSNNELKESKYENPSNTAIDSFFKAYEVRDIEKQSQTKRKYSNTFNSNNEQPNKRRCKAETFEVIQYSLGPNEEYIAIRSYEYDIWERNEDNMSKIYQDIFQKKDEGWKVTRTK